jgi:hypothetical protein
MSETAVTDSSSDSRRTAPGESQLAAIFEQRTKSKAADELKRKQDEWRMNEKIVKDLESVKGRSPDEDRRLQDAKRVLLMTDKPAGAGRKTRRRGKKAKKVHRKTKSRRAH